MTRDSPAVLPTSDPSALSRAGRDALSGLASAVVLLAVHGSYGVIALAPLGPAYAPTGFLMGVLAAVLANLVTAAAGDRGPMLSGPSAALALLVPPLIAALMAHPALTAGGGTPDTARVLALVGLGIALAGLLQLVVGTFRLGLVVRFVPYPVHAGFMTSVAVLIVMAMVPHAMGLAPRAGGVDWSQARPLALLVTAVSLALSLVRLPGLRRVPPLLVAIVAGSLLHHGLAAWAGPSALGPVLGAVPLAWPTPDALGRWAGPDLWAAAVAAAVPLMQFAGALALTASLQSVLATSAMDTLMGQRRDGDGMLRAQGVSNLVGGLVGVLPSAAALSYGAVNRSCGAQGTVSRVAHGLGQLLLLSVGVGLVQHLPMTAIAGTFIAAGWGLVDPWTRHALRDSGRALLRGGRPPRGLLGPVLVVLAVTAVSLSVSLIAGVGAGLVAAMLLFVRDHMRPPVRRVSTGVERGSRKLRGPAETARLRDQAHRIVTVELDGPLFFGTADAAVRVIEAAARSAEHVVVDLRRVREIDASGARVLVQAAGDLAARGHRLALAGLDPDGPRGRVVREMDLRGVLPATRMHPDADRALEEAEDALLADDRATAPLAEGAALALADTRLGDGLTPLDQALLEAHLVTVHYTAGETVFRSGDAGTSLFVLRAGQVAIRLPADDRGGLPPQRLVSYAPGAVFGELGLLRQMTRTADAVCEADSTLGRLDADALRALAHQHPALHGALMRNLALQVADRLSALTLEVQALDDRVSTRSVDRAD